MTGRRTTIAAAGILAASIVVATISSAMFQAPRTPTSTQISQTPGVGQQGDQPALQQAPGRPRLQEIERLIRAFSEQTDETPNATGLAFLGRLELERARLTGDVASYTHAQRALAEAYRLAPRDPDIGTLLATVRFTVHDFTGAFDLAGRLYEGSSDPGALAVRGDSALELGSYDQATADYRTLAALVPHSASVQVRLARLAFLQGRPEEADRLASEALLSARREGAFGPTLAFYDSFRGRLALDAGRYDVAAHHYQRAVRAAPDYHVSIAGLGSVRVAQGRFQEAITLYRSAARIVPEPTYLAMLGDLYVLTGREDLARRQYDTVDAIAQLTSASRRLYDRQLALYFADHNVQLGDALAIAQESLEVRKDVYGYDVLAWVLYRLGRYDEAREASDTALALGTPDARLWYHAGLISAAIGDDTRAVSELSAALRLSPNFDPIQSPVAREALAALGGAG